MRLLKTSLLFILLVSCGMAQTPLQNEVPMRYSVGGIIYEVYQNLRFAYTLPYPVGLLVPQAESANGDGRAFVAPNDGATLRAYGNFSYMDETLAETFERESRDTPDRRVTYKMLQDEWFVVSGYENDSIFYRKTLMPAGCLVQSTFHLTYSEALRETYAPVVAEMASSFRSGECRG